MIEKRLTEALGILRGAHAREPDRFDVETVNYLEQVPTCDQLTNIVRYLGLRETRDDLRALVREDQMADAPYPVTSRALASLVAERPLRLQRPILVDWFGGRAVIARPPEKVEDFLKELDRVGK